MLRAYQGYFNNGRFISLDNCMIPEKKRVIITVLDDESTDIKTVDNPNQQRSAFEEYFMAIDMIDDEQLTDADFTELENNRLNFIGNKELVNAR